MCDDAYKSDLTTTIYFAGVMLGGVVFGILADKYGRKRVVMLALLSSGIVGVATFVLRRNYFAFIILRFLLGFLMQVSVYERPLHLSCNIQNNLFMSNVLWFFAGYSKFFIYSCPGDTVNKISYYRRFNFCYIWCHWCVIP